MALAVDRNTIRRMAGAGGGRRGTAKAGVVVVAVLAAAIALATLGVAPPLGVVFLVVLGAATLLGRVLPGAHGWVALGGAALAALGVALALLALGAADDPWADLILVLSVIVVAAVGCAWGAGIWLGRLWRRRSAT